MFVNVSKFCLIGKQEIKQSRCEKPAGELNRKDIDIGVGGEVYVSNPGWVKSNLLSLFTE